MRSSNEPGVPQNKIQGEAIEAPIRAVTVYSDRARITRRGQVTLEAGAARIGGFEAVAEPILKLAQPVFGGGAMGGGSSGGHTR